MSKIIALIALVISLGLPPSTATAQQTRTVNFESRLDAAVNGAVCLVKINGQTLKITTPSKVKLPLNDEKQLIVDSLQCSYRGVTKATDNFPDKNYYGSTIHGVTVDFISAKAEFWFKKKNGSVGLYIRGDKVVMVR